MALCSVLLASATASPTAATSRLVGIVSGAPAGSLVRVRAYQVPADGIGITKEDVYLDLDATGTTATARRVNASRTDAAADGTFAIPVSSSSLYTVLAWADINRDGRLDLPFEPVGWFAASGAHWMTALTVDAMQGRVAIRVSAPAPMPNGTLQTINGHLHDVAGLRTLSVSGSPKERGLAHGRLLGQQIIDFFRFFTLQSTTNSTDFYTSRVVPFVNTSGGWYDYSHEYLEEIDAMLQGISESPSLVRGMWVEELGRDLERVDLLYLNDYGNYPEAPQAMRRACSQFAFWGDASASGRLVAGRNMDGENDFRKVTVSHFLALSVTPDDGASPFVHFMWPGFVAVASGVSRAGLWVMMNDGQSNPDGPLAHQLSPFGWVAVVLESDRAHNAWREPNQVQPLIRQGIMVTNHEFLPPAFDPSAPLDNWGRQVYFSSLWRYEAGKNLVNAFTELGVKVGLGEMKRLLQTVTHATTEHTVILEDTGAGGLVLHVAVADLRVGGWHAPYLRWHRAEISEFFAAAEPPEEGVL